MPSPISSSRNGLPARVTLSRALSTWHGTSALIELPSADVAAAISWRVMHLKLHRMAALVDRKFRLAGVDWMNLENVCRHLCPDFVGGISRLGANRARRRPARIGARHDQRPAVRGLHAVAMGNRAGKIARHRRPFSNHEPNPGCPGISHLRHVFAPASHCGGKTGRCHADSIRYNLHRAASARAGRDGGPDPRRRSRRHRITFGLLHPPGRHGLGSPCAGSRSRLVFPEFQRRKLGAPGTDAGFFHATLPADAPLWSGKGRTKEVAFQIVLRH